MTFYEKIIQELERAEQSLSTVYTFAFRFTNEALFEWDENGRICTVTYGEAQRRIESATAALHTRLSAYPAGGPVGIYLPNGIDWVVAFWAILRAGYRPLLLNTNAPLDMVEGCLTECAAKHVIGNRDFTAAETIAPDALTASGDYCDWADEIILCTSGTTGKPRLIAFDGKAVCAQIRNSGYVLKENHTVATFYHGHLKLLAFLPFYHIFGLSAVLLWFSCFGRTLVLLPSLAPEVISETCQKHEVTHIFCLPIFWNAVADAVLRTAKRTGQAEKLEKGLKLSLALQSGLFPRLGRWFAREVLFRSVQRQALGNAVRFCITGGGAVREDTMRLINGIAYPLYNGYGMTEIGIASVELRHSAKARMEGSIGKLFPSMEAKQGENSLWVRGRTCYTATYENGVRIPHDPLAWFDTKDCIEIRKGGYLFFAGRTDDMINGENGERIAPAVIEAAFGSPLIQNLAAVEQKRPGGGTMAVLVVEPKQHNAYALGNLAEQLYAKNAALPRAYRVDRIVFAEEPLPLALTMKVQNGEVKKRLANGTLRVHAADRPTEKAETLYEKGLEEILPRVMAAFADVTGMDNVTPDSHFQYDLGGDSLQYFSLIERIGADFGVTIDTHAAPELNTPRAVAAYILKEAE